MYRIICIGLIALPAYLYNAEVSLASSNINVPIITAKINKYSVYTKVKRSPQRFASREDQTGDCLRIGRCRD
ncbi:hypothetical protein H6G80_29070 [Nostoc sp. FACHB-87]|uniref:hypothetical protein n=1 Tax=Nostocaceae TaxID=1162 RepID=UPI0016839FDA|nr:MULTISPECIES: hypothetical protein [Nostocaceae]MBD2299301.1 hypothetical protein [Nostoc sp. FACHB-190]MBD2458104.1 hypothetical protein [Nostoc sp. FACHB-87]MBD2479301.1 hypothetical protein [Anabaena sp. FACHB-83]